MNSNEKNNIEVTGFRILANKPEGYVCSVSFDDGTSVWRSEGAARDGSDSFVGAVGHRFWNEGSKVAAAFGAFDPASAEGPLTFVSSGVDETVGEAALFVLLSEMGKRGRDVRMPAGFPPIGLACAGEAVDEAGRAFRALELCASPLAMYVRPTTAETAEAAPVAACEERMDATPEAPTAEDAAPSCVSAEHVFRFEDVFVSLRHDAGSYEMLSAAKGKWTILADRPSHVDVGGRDLDRADVSAEGEMLRDMTFDTLSGALGFVIGKRYNSQTGLVPTLRTIKKLIQNAIDGGNEANLDEILTSRPSRRVETEPTVVKRMKAVTLERRESKNERADADTIRTATRMREAEPSFTRHKADGSYDFVVEDHGARRGAVILAGSKVANCEDFADGELTTDGILVADAAFVSRSAALRAAKKVKSVGGDDNKRSEKIGSAEELESWRASVEAMYGHVDDEVQEMEYDDFFATVESRCPDVTFLA